MTLLRTLGFVLMLAFAATAYAGDDKPAQPAPATSPAAKEITPSAQAEVNEKWMVEGQKRYLTNCGRCHQSPRQFSPREMSMAVRHMRVRAMLTQEDMDYLLYYMTHQ